MKGYFWVTMALVFVAGTASAAPSVALDGNMFIWSPDNHNDSFTNYGVMVKIPWTGGTAGVIDDDFFTAACDTLGDPDYFGFGNAHIYGDSVMVMAADNQGVRRYTFWKVDQTTGAATDAYVSTNGDLGYYTKFGIDVATGDIYTTSTGDKRGNLLSDGNNDDDYKDGGEQQPLGIQPTSIWSSGGYSHDAQYFDGNLYFASSAIYDDGRMISRLRNTTTDNGAVCLPFTAYGGDPSWTNGPIYLAVGDPDGDGHVDIYAHSGACSPPEYNDNLVHWEDLNDDLNFDASEIVDWHSVGGDPRDVELVSDGTNAMLVYMMVNGGTLDLYYVNLTDNGMFDESGRLLDTDLNPDTDEWVYVVMDQTQTAIPEPTTMLLLGTGALGAIGWIRRRKMR